MNEAQKQLELTFEQEEQEQPHLEALVLSIQPDCCENCGEEFTKKRSDHRFCSKICKDTAYRSSLSEEIKEENNRRRAEKRLAFKIKAVELFGGKCQMPDCGYNTCMAALQFHHVDKGSKEFRISAYAQDMDFEDVLPELRKCVMVCANHHAEIHAGLRDAEVAAMKRLI